MANQVVKFPNGNEYSADGSTPKDMLNGGHSEHFMPMINDVVSLANDVEATAQKVASDAETVKSALQASKLAVDSATEAARSSSEAAVSAGIAREAANQALNAVSAGVVDDSKVSKSTTFSSFEIDKKIAACTLSLSNVEKTVKALDDANTDANKMKDFKLISSSFAVPGAGLYALDSRGKELVISLPAEPIMGFEVHFMDPFNSHESSPVKIVSQHKIMGSQESFKLDVAGAFTKLRFIAELSDWRLV